MATGLRTTYITLGTLPLRSRALHAYDWSDLLKDAPKDGQNRKLPGLHGTEPRPRTRGEVRAALLVRVDGAWSVSNGPAPDPKANVYTLLTLLREVTSGVGVTTVTLTTPSESWVADCQIEDGGTPRFVSPTMCELAVDLTLPNGSLL